MQRCRRGNPASGRPQLHPEMKLENSLGLPEPIVNAIRGDDYQKGDCDFSVTELIKPVRIRALGKKWSEHLTEDVSDRIFSLFGKAMHKVLEMAADPRYSMVEKRYYADFNLGDCWECGGDGAWLNTDLDKMIDPCQRCNGSGIMNL